MGIGSEIASGRHGEPEPDAWIHENAVTAMRTGADQTMVYADRGGRDVPVYFGSEPDAEREAPRRPTDAEIDDACMWYRHDYGLLDGEERDGVRFDAVEWLRAWIKVRDGDCPGWDHRAAPTAQEEPDLCICTGDHGSNPNCAYRYQREENGVGGTRAEPVVQRSTDCICGGQGMCMLCQRKRGRSTEGEAERTLLAAADYIERAAEGESDHYRDSRHDDASDADWWEGDAIAARLRALAARTEPSEDRLREAERLLVNASFPHAADCLRRFGSDCSCDSESLRAARRRWLSTTEET